jgi:hypothetical protein
MTCSRHLRIYGIPTPSERIFSGDRNQRLGSSESAWQQGTKFEISDDTRPAPELSDHLITLMLSWNGDRRGKIEDEGMRGS